MTSPQVEKTMLITGASSGIGHATALVLAQKGVRLFLNGRNRERLERLAEAVLERGAEARVLVADLGREAARQEMCDTVFKLAERLDVLMHSAGLADCAPFEEASAENFLKMFQVNVLAPFALTQSLLPLVKRAQGDIVFINSRAGITPASPHFSQYDATKYALVAVAGALRQEVRAEGVRVISVYPGKVATPMLEQLQRKQGRPYAPETLVQPEDVAATIQWALAMPRNAEVCDVTVQPRDEDA